jgi:hypothetical protein
MNIGPVHSGISSPEQLVSALKPYKPGSISTLIISGHASACGCAVSHFKPPSLLAGLNPFDQYPSPTPIPGARPLNQNTLSGDIAAQIRPYLKPGAVVQIWSCWAGENTDDMQILANNLQATVQACNGCTHWGPFPGIPVCDGPWVTVTPNGPPAAGKGKK